MINPSQRPRYNRVRAMDSALRRTFSSIGVWSIARRLSYAAAVMLLSTWALTAQVKSGDESPRARVT